MNHEYIHERERKRRVAKIGMLRGWLAVADLLDNHTGHGDGDNEPSDLQIQRPPNPDLSFQLLHSASNRVTVPSPWILGTIRFGLNSHLLY
jgi:hypothetical protein